MFQRIPFVPANSHPYNCWIYENNKLKQYILNNVFRRQDLPDAWELYHYLCCFKISELSSLDSQLINKKTFPIFLNKKTADKLIEVDTPEAFEKWAKKSPNAFKKWEKYQRSLRRINE